MTCEQCPACKHLHKRLRAAEQRASRLEALAELRLAQVHALRMRMAKDFRAHVEHDVYRIIAASGVGAPFRPELAPALAAVASQLRGVALQAHAASKRRVV